MALFGPTKRTYSKRKPVDYVDFQENLRHQTLDESLWKDSFDKLLADKNELKQKNVLTSLQNINPDFNRNSSLDSPSPLLKKKRKLKYNAKKRKQQIPTWVGKNQEFTSSVSTPKGRQPLQRLNKLNFSISPIASPSPPPFDPMKLYNKVFPDSYIKSSLPSIHLSDAMEMPWHRKSKRVVEVEVDLIDNPEIQRDLLESHNDMNKTRSIVLKLLSPRDDSKRSVAMTETSIINLNASSVFLGFEDSSLGLKKSQSLAKIPKTNYKDLSSDINGTTSLNEVVESISIHSKDSSLNESQDCMLIEKTMQEADEYFATIETRKQPKRQPPPTVTLRRSSRLTRTTSQQAPQISSNLVAGVVGLKEPSPAMKLDNSVEECRSSKAGVSWHEPLMILPPGKWRKSLVAWRKRNSIHRSAKSLAAQKTRTLIKMEDIEEESEGLVLEPTDETCNLSKSLLRRDEGEEKRSEDNQQHHRQTYPNQRSIFRSQSYVDDDRDHYKHQIRTRQISGQRKTSVYERSTSHIPAVTLERRPSWLLHELIIPLSPSSQAPTARDIVLRHCNQSAPLTFEQAYDPNTLCHWRKVGEGVYSEVFMSKNAATGRPVVLKVIPIEGQAVVNGETQKKFEEILPEIVIATELSDLRHDSQYMTNNFVETVRIRCIRGKYPQQLIDLWELYQENYGSENDHPEVFDESQLFIVLELANAGQDLESFEFHNAQQTYSALLQVAITLAIAEKRFEFEHRDLHWGNVLLARTEEKFINYRIGGESVRVPTHGVRATIIDFTLSRMVVNGCRHFNDLSQDEELFSASGDYQFDIYRLMRDRLDNEWDRFEPFTNLLWVHYVCDKMIHGARYKSTKSKKHREAVNELMQLRDTLLEYRSVSEFVEALEEIR